MMYGIGMAKAYLTSVRTFITLLYHQLQQKKENEQVPVRHIPNEKKTAYKRRKIHVGNRMKEIHSFKNSSAVLVVKECACT